MSEDAVWPFDDHAREHLRRAYEQAERELRVGGVLYFDSDDDFSFEFPLREHFLPQYVNGNQQRIRYGLFLGWEYSIDIAQAFLKIVSGGPAIAAWRFLEMLHQGGGHMTVQRSFLVTPVRLREDAMQSATDIVRHYWRSQLSMPRDARACDRSDYIALARRHGLTADEALARTDCLMESIYPMDASQSNLERLAVDPGRHRRSLEAFVKSDLLANRLCLFLVSDNCD